MPRSTNTVIENTFTGGLNTQATALNFPPNACIDQSNCIFSERGIVSRRFGYEFENNYILNSQVSTEYAQSTYLWKNASGDGLTNLVVQQNGSTLSFYSTSNGLSLSAGLSINTVNLNSFAAAGASTANLNQNECQYSTGLGYLFVVHPYCDPFYIKLNSDGTFTSSIITFTVRDVFGIPEPGVLTDNRPSVLTATHQYNLYNQGWNSSHITTFQTGASAYPSNADVWQIYKDSTNTFVVNATTLASNSRGTTPAPQGYFRLNPWNTQRATVANTQAGLILSLSNADETSGTLRPAVTEFHAGRVWYTGVNAQGYTNRVYFSKVVQQPSDFGYCGAFDDPTSPTLFDFVASDGGIISIPQAGTIYRLVSLGPNLIVFGANGVWAITGSKGVGFAANDYNVANLSYVRSLASTSYVVAEGSVFWWNQSDINVLQQGDTGYNVKSITYDTIKNYYTQNIPTGGKKFARGAYNPRTHIVQWLFKAANPIGLTDTYTFDTVLNYNLLSGAFYTWSQPSSPVSINSIVVIEGAGSATGTSNVTDNLSDQVIDGLGDNIITYGFSQTIIQTTTKYLVSYSLGNGSYQYTFAENFNPSYKDWNIYTAGTDFTSYFVTGYTVKTQGMRKFTVPYIYIFNDLTQITSQGNPSYTFQTQWNYGNINTSGVWTQRQTIQQTINHTETSYDASRRRLKVRGSGTSVQFRFTSKSGTPFNIAGWSTYDTANQQP